MMNRPGIKAFDVCVPLNLLELDTCWRSREGPGGGDQVSFSGSLIPGRRPRSGLGSCVYTHTHTWINNSREPVLIKCVTDTRVGAVTGEGGGSWSGSK